MSNVTSVKVIKFLIVFFWFPVSLYYLYFIFSLLLNYTYAKTPKAAVNNNSLLFSYIVSPYPTRPVNLSPDEDIRVIALKNFFTDINSPLKDYAQDLVYQADIWGLDYALIPAISMQESRACKIIPPESHNCWGFGIYGKKVTRFKSYPEAITKIAKTIKEAYVKKGLTNATLVEDLWAPPSKGQWSYSVNYYIGKIKEYEKSQSGT